jgi:hypothetical protein
LYDEALRLSDTSHLIVCHRWAFTPLSNPARNFQSLIDQLLADVMALPICQFLGRLADGRRSGLRDCGSDRELLVNNTVIGDLTDGE